MIVADLRAGAVHALVAGARVVEADPGSALQASAQHIVRLGQEAVLAGVEQADQLALGDGQPKRRSCSSSRGVVT